MARDFYRHNSADEDKKLAAVELSDGRLVLLSQNGFTGQQTRYAASASDPTVEYYGRAVPGALASDPAWLISRTATALNGSVSKSYPDGEAAYTKVWDDRESYTY